jgi:hypothetical protein
VEVEATLTLSLNWINQVNGKNEEGEGGSLGREPERKTLAIDLARHGLGHLEVNPIRWRWQCQFESSIIYIAISMPFYFQNEKSP